jgi:hypothetical protein
VLVANGPKRGVSAYLEAKKADRPIAREGQVVVTHVRVIVGRLRARAAGVLRINPSAGHRRRKGESEERGEKRGR